MTDIVDDVPTTAQKFAAEVLGTFVLVFFGVGAALMSGGDYVATGLAFGLTVVVMAYAVGRVSGGHFNPAVTVGAALGGRLPWRVTPVYIGAQLVGGLVAGLFLFTLMHGFDGFSAAGGLGANSYGDQGSGYAWWAAFLLEMLLTAVFLWVILAVTDARNELQAVMGPLAIGLALAMIHFASMGATGTSVNPARSIGVGLFAGVDAIAQLWVFILAPLVGAVIAGLTYPLLFGQGAAAVEGSGLSFGGGRRRTRAAYPPPGTYEQQWNQGQAAPQWPAAPPYPPQPESPYAPQPESPYAPQQQWGQAPSGYEQQWGATQQPQQQPPASPPGQWGRPAGDDDEDGRTQIRRPDHP